MSLPTLILLQRSWKNWICDPVKDWVPPFLISNTSPHSVEESFCILDELVQNCIENAGEVQEEWICDPDRLK